MLCNDFTGPAHFRLNLPEVVLELKRVWHPCFRGISRLGSAFIFLWWFKLAHICIQVTSLHKWKKQGINHKFLIGNRFHVTLRIVSLISVTMLCLWLPLLCLSVAFTIFQNFGHFWSRSALAMKRQIWPFHEIWLVSAIFSVCHCWMKSSFGRNFFVFLYCLDGFHDT